MLHAPCAQEMKYIMFPYIPVEIYMFGYLFIVLQPNSECLIKGYFVY